MSGSSLDGLDIVFAEIQEQQGKWRYEIVAADCLPYTPAWETQLQNAIHLSAKDYLLLHTAYGKYIGEQINNFIDVTDNSKLSKDRFTDNNQSPSDVSYPLTCSASDS
jgi:anhydro-N-acetylmuramic acid kinase